MYTYEQRIKAVKLYIKYGRSAAATVHELGYEVVQLEWTPR